ncbi:MAG: FliG C-terminal domain-containing protein [Leptospirales bacterium]
MILNSMDDITSLEDKQVQLLLRELEMDELTIALKGVNPEVMEKLYKNMSPRAVEKTKERSDAMGAVPIESVEKSHANILRIAAKLDS